MHGEANHEKIHEKHASNRILGVESMWILFHRIKSLCSTVPGCHRHDRKHGGLSISLQEMIHRLKFNHAKSTTFPGWQWMFNSATGLA